MKKNNSTQKINLGKGIFFIPSEQELEYASNCGFGNIYRSPIAVRNRKVVAQDMLAFEDAGEAEREGLRTYIQKYPKYQFLYHPQFKAGAILTAKHLATIDKAQDIKELPYFLVYQFSPDAPPQDFQARINHCMKEYTDKIIVPVIDPLAQDPNLLKQKVQWLVATGFKSVVVLYRNPKDTLDAWSIISANLNEAHVDMIAIGVSRRWTKEELDDGGVTYISTYCGALIFGCKGVCHYRPWSGGPSEDVFLDGNMSYKFVSSGTKGHVVYNGKDRLAQYQNIKKSNRYFFCRVDAVLEADATLGGIEPLVSGTSISSILAKIEGLRLVAQKLGLA